MTKNKNVVNAEKGKTELSDEKKRQKALKKLRKDDEEETEFADLLDEADDELYHMLKKLK
jgi:hypothetical protein